MKSIMEFVLVAFLSSVCAANVGICESPPIDFMKLKIHANILTDCKVQVTLEDFVTKLPTGYWERLNESQWSYKYSVNDTFAERAYNIALLFGKLPPPDPNAAYTGGFNSKEMAEHFYNDCVNVDIRRMIINGTEVDRNHINKFVGEIGNPILRAKEPEKTILSEAGTSRPVIKKKIKKSELPERKTIQPEQRKEQTSRQDLALQPPKEAIQLAQEKELDNEQTLALQPSEGAIQPEQKKKLPTIHQDISLNEAKEETLLGKEMEAAALLDRQKKDEGKKRAKIFIEEVASAYRLSASPFEVDDNGDGTVNVTFEVKAEMSINSDPRTYYVTGIPGVNFDEFLSTGLTIENNRITKKDFYVACRNKKCKETFNFMESELTKLLLSIKLGEFEKKVSLSEQFNQMPNIMHKLIKKYNVKMSLSEVKSLTPLKMRILYDSKEYGQEKKPPNTQDLEQLPKQVEKEETINNNIIGITVQERKPNALLKIVANSPVRLIITTVRSESPAEIAGLRAGDMVYQFDGKMMHSLRQFKEAMFAGIQRGRMKLSIGRGFQNLRILNIGININDHSEK